jgi:divinyl protochlorophyllide a 8-vinyl-reductase
MSADHFITPEKVGRIGPNAIVRTREALVATEGQNVADRLFAAAGLARYNDAPPETMVDEAEVTDLMRCIAASLGPERAQTVGWIGGQRTGDYLLANRIPRAAQVVLKALTAAVASRLLVRSIRGHTWTFAGTGRVTFQSGNPTRIGISGCPLCRGISASKPACAFYTATFERLFAALVHPQAKAVEVACTATGSTQCLFEIRWPRRQHRVVRGIHQSLSWRTGRA